MSTRRKNSRPRSAGERIVGIAALRIGEAIRIEVVVAGIAVKCLASARVERIQRPDYVGMDVARGHPPRTDLRRGVRRSGSRANTSKGKPGGAWARVMEPGGRRPVGGFHAGWR